MPIRLRRTLRRRNVRPRRPSCFLAVLLAASLAASLRSAEGSGPPRGRTDEPIEPGAVRVLAAGARGMAEIRGQPGSVPPRRWVVVHTLDTGEYVFTRADAAGGFSLEAFAPVGSVLAIHHRAGRPIHGELHPDPTSSPALIIDLAPSNAAGERGDIAAAAVFPLELARAIIRARISRAETDPGGVIRVSGELRLVAIESARTASAPGGIDCHFELARLFRADGGPVAPVRLLASAFLTPTGLPVEAPEDVASVGCGRCRISARAVRRKTSVLEAPFQAALRMPENLPAGYYMLGCRVAVDPGTFRSDRPWERPFQEIQEFLPPRLAILRIGRPARPRMALMLLPGMVSNGSRGVLPLRSDRRWAVSPAAVFQAPLSIFPRRFPDGRPVPFRFEPGLPLVSRANRPFLLTLPRPLIPLELPGGEWAVTIRSPSGKVLRLGPSRFVAGRNNLSVLEEEAVNPARDRIGAPLAYGNNYLCDVYALTTADRREFVRFLDEEGAYTVRTEGSVLDRFSHRYDLSGRFEFAVARPMDLDLGLLPGTPLTAGDAVSPVVHVRPAMPADVTIRLRHYPDSRLDTLRERTLRGRANRAGYFAPDGPPIRIDRPGEYAIDVIARARDEREGLWLAAVRGASVAAPKEQVIIPHGERGLRSPESTRRLAWYVEGLRSDVVRAPGAGMHAVFPYHGGDVLWVEDHESIFPAVRFQDPTGRYADIVESLRPEVREGTYAGFFNRRLLPIDMRVIGELPLFSRATGGRPIGQYPDEPEYVSYAYTSTQRPGLSVRSLVHESSFLAYWSLDDPYNLQYGAGREGDLPNDVKLQFAGIVLRGPAGGAPQGGPEFPQYAVYSTVAVVVPRGDRLGNRVTPPFRGAGGGPDGGPLLRIRGRDHDLFVTPTGILPGTVSSVGDRFVYSGYVWPPLAADVRWSVAGPDGEVRESTAAASRVGYFYDPQSDFTLREPGLYALRVRVTYSGATSAGSGAKPFPRGDLLGTSDGLSHFVVVDPGEPPLDVEISSPMWGRDGRLRPEALRRPAQVSFRAHVPPGWSRARGFSTVWMPGFLIDERSLAVAGATFAYDFDAEAFRREFPNIDEQPVDTFVVTLSASGLDGNGRRQARARTLVVQGPRVW